MSKKLKFLVAAGVAAVVIIGGAAVPILAADTPIPTPFKLFAPNDDLMEKTAAILGITTDTLTTAFQEVREELKPVAPLVDDYHTRVAKILGITVETLTNAEKQALEEARSSTPAPSDASGAGKRFIITDMAERVAKILGIATDTLTAAEKQARTEMLAEMKERMPAIAPAKDERLEKVAQKLGITLEKLTSAMEQAAKEISQTRLEESLADAVANNTITQAEADQIKAWLAQRPAALDKLPGFGGQFRGGLTGSGGRIERFEIGPGCGPDIENGRAFKFGGPRGDNSATTTPTTPSN